MGGRGELCPSLYWIFGIFNFAKPLNALQYRSSADELPNDATQKSHVARSMNGQSCINYVRCYKDRTSTNHGEPVENQLKT